MDYIKPMRSVLPGCETSDLSGRDDALLRHADARAARPPMTERPGFGDRVALILISVFI